MQVISRHENLSAGPGRGQNSKLRVYGRLGDGTACEVDVNVDHSYQWQGHARLSRWTPTGYEQAVTIPEPCVGRAGDSLDPILDELVRTHDELFLPRPPVVVGQRYELTESVERYPHFFVPAGAVGTITEIVEDQVNLRIDSEVIDGAEEWDNEIVFYDEDVRDLARLVSEVPGR